LQTGIFTNFKNYKTPQTNAISMPEISPYAVSYSMPETELDFFDTNEGKTATNTGGAIVIGLVVRELLQHWSNKLFSNYFSKHPEVSSEELLKIGNKMLDDKIKESKSPEFKNIKVDIASAGQDAYFNHATNQIKVTKNTLISLPHEIGHAVQEHSTKFFKALQRNRGNYTTLALLLYGLGRSKPINKKGEETISTKLQNLLYKYNVLVPLIAFSPELITEYKASKIGIDYLKKHVNSVEEKLKHAASNKQLSTQLTNAKSILKAAKKHYAIAFCTYLALPVFAMLDNFIFKQFSKD